MLSVSLEAICEAPRMPTFCMIPTMAETFAYCRSGSWSAMVAMKGANAALAPSWAMNQPRASTGTDCACEMSSSAAAITRTPPIIHGRRRPKREVVRSESRPKRALPAKAAMAPTPSTRPRALVRSVGLASRVLTLRAMLTITGPSRATKRPNCAKPMAKTKAGDLGSVGLSPQRSRRGRAGSAVWVGMVIVDSGDPGPGHAARRLPSRAPPGAPY